MFSEYSYQSLGDLWLAPWRAYSVALGRWISEDPVKDGINLYSFVQNRPTVMSDIDGLRAFPRLPGWISKPLRVFKFLNCGYEQELCNRQVDAFCEAVYGPPAGWIGGPNRCDWCELKNRQCCKDQAVKCMTEIPVIDPRDDLKCKPTRLFQR